MNTTNTYALEQYILLKENRFFNDKRNPYYNIELHHTRLLEVFFYSFIEYELLYRCGVHQPAPTARLLDWCDVFNGDDPFGITIEFESSIIKNSIIANYIGDAVNNLNRDVIYVDKDYLIFSLPELNLKDQNNE